MTIDLFPRYLPLSNPHLRQDLERSALCAIARKKPSVPTRWLVQQEYLRSMTVLHFGSGKAQFDTKLMDKQGYCRVTEYDYNYTPQVLAPGVLNATYDAVVCNYVLNVLPPGARHYTLQQLAAIDATVWYITVRSHRAEVRGTMEQDGVRTFRKTFQRTYTPEQLRTELLQYFSTVLTIFNKGEALIASVRFPVR